MSEHKYSKREERAEGEIEPPLGGGEPEPPLQEPPELPDDEQVRVFGDASATYGSMVPPETIRPYAPTTKVEPIKKEEHSKETKEAADHTVKAAQATVKELRAEQHSREHKGHK
jgi:hypothetical protein